MPARCSPVYFALSALTCILPLPCSSQTFSLSGYVVDGMTGQPISGARLHLFLARGGDPAERSGRVAPPITPDADGHFAFTGLPAHSYSLQAELPHELVRYGETEDPLYLLGDRRIEVGPKSEGKTLTFRIWPQAVLSGVLRDKFADRIEGAGIELFRWERRDAHIRLVPIDRSSTDERGEYRFQGLSPGEYALCAAFEYFHGSPLAEGVVKYRPGYSQIYTRTCFPDPESAAARFRVEAGARARLDLKVASTPAFPLRITGLIWPDSESLSLGRMWPAYAVERNDATREVLRPEGTFLPGGGVELSDVAPGRYIVEARVVDLKGPGSIGRQEVEIGKVAPALVKLQPFPNASIEFKVSDTGGNTLNAGDVNVSFVPVTAQLKARPLRDSPMFALDPGAYWLSVHTHQPFCASSAHLNAGHDILREQTDVGSGSSARLDVKLTKQCGTINIQTTSEGQSVPFANFLLLLSGTPQSPGGVIVGSSDAQGRASIGPLTPGKYLIWAWSSNSNGYIGPELADVAGLATEVAATAGQITSIAIAPLYRAGGFR